MGSIKAILRTPLFKVTSLNSLSVILKIGIGLFTSKIIAVFVGPSGMALVGNLRNFLSSLETIATLGFQNGIVKYVAQNQSQQDQLKKVLSTVFISMLTIAVLLSCGLFFLADMWNDTIFGAGFQYAFVFKALAAALPWYALSILLIAVINGLSKFRQVVYINIFGNILGLVLSVLLIWQYRTFGALLSIIIAPSLVFFIALWFTNKEIKLFQYIAFESFSGEVIKRMASYSLMALVSAVISPLVFLAIRNNVIDMAGINQAGFWEAMQRISTYYFMFIGTIIPMYFLPRLVTAKNNTETGKVFLSYYKSILPLFIIAMVVLFFLKDLVVHILFTKEFLPVKNLFLWQLSGDILKAFSVILGYNLVARKYTVVFIITEFISMAMMYFSSKYLVGIYGVEGVVMAHFLTYLLYAVVLVIYFRKIFYKLS